MGAWGKRRTVAAAASALALALPWGACSGGEAADPGASAGSGASGTTGSGDAMPDASTAAVDAASPVAAGSGVDASLPAAPDATTGGAGGDAAPATGDAAAGSGCEVAATRVVPTVMFLVDGSNSMVEPYDPSGDPATGPSRWQALREALVGAGGVVHASQHAVAFGLAVYGTEPACPFPVGILGAQLGNAAAVEGALPVMPPGQLTPTGLALEQVLDLLPDPLAPSDPGIGEQVIVLATDGDPNGCEVFVTGPAGYEESLAAAMRAHQNDVRLEVFGFGSDVSAVHLQEVANLGAGLPVAERPGATVHQPADPAELGAALAAVVGTLRLCDVALDAAVVDGRACDGTVTLGGSPLPCDDPDGWTLSAERRVTLRGEGCERWRADASPALSVRFPCEALR